MTEVNNDSYYMDPASYLQQGDIFRIDLVAPVADEVQRIFRAKDGRHGSVVFEQNCEARVFSRNDLDNLLAAISQTPLHTKPFHKTPDGYDEMVVVFARLFRYFIIATQTCDISGKNKGRSEWATILPVIPLVDLCKTEPMPFASTYETLTIHEFVTKYCEKGGELQNSSAMDYVPRLRQLVNDSIKSKQNEKVRKDTQFLKNYLSNYYAKIFMFSLPANVKYNLPESYVDFTSAFTVHTSKLLAIQDLRFARIAVPYSFDFAQKFGHFFTRVALPKQMRPT